MLPWLMDGEIRTALRGRTAAMLSQIERLVDINSFTGNKKGCALVGDLLADLFHGIPGMLVRRIGSKAYGPHLLASTRLAETSSKGAIAIIGHLDTVFPPGDFEGFHLEGPIARGPGVLDMKGGLVVAIEGLRVLAELGLLERLPIRFAIVSDEEVGSPESQPILASELAGAACSVTLEAGRAEDKVITARKGTGKVTVNASGVAAHAGNRHQEGANAIWALASFADLALRLTDYETGITINVGTVTGGTTVNTVPDHASAEVDFRFVKSGDGEVVFAKLQESARMAVKSVNGAARAAVEKVTDPALTAGLVLPVTSIELEINSMRPPLERTEANVALYREYAVHAKAAGLEDGESGLVGGGSDASTAAAIGVPSIDGLGPRGTGFHTRDELIEVSTLVPKAEALAAFLAGRIRH